MKTIKTLTLLFAFGLLIFVSTGCDKFKELTGGDKGDHGYGGDGGGIAVDNLFDLSDAEAVATASSSEVSPSSLRTQGILANTLLKKIKDKLTGKFSLSTAISNTSFISQIASGNISVIEKNPADGSLYIGLNWGVQVTVTNSDGSKSVKNAYLFKITPIGPIGNVTKNVEVIGSSDAGSNGGMGSWYSDPNSSELPKKQIQFDSAGNIYYLFQQSGGQGRLKVYRTDKTTTTIGGPTHSVRDFIVYRDSTVLFHGSDASNWSIEWLRVYVGSSVYNIFYSDQTQGSYGYMRSYFLDKNRNVILAVSNITFEQGTDEIKCSGIVRVPLDENGKPKELNILYDDNNMYSDTYNTIAQQMMWGYWDNSTGTNKKFFKADNTGTTTFPLVLETGVTEDSIRSYIRNKYQSITVDNLNNLVFSGLTFTGIDMWNHNAIIEEFNKLINNSIQGGVTWADFRKTNELEGVQFGSAKQILPLDDGTVIATMKLDSWGASGSLKGDKLFSIISPEGKASISSYQRDSSYKTINKALAWRNYIFCLVSRAGKSKILRYEANNPTGAPTDLTSNLSNAEINSFNIDSSNGTLSCGVYDYSNNSASMIEITPEGEISQVSTKSFTILDVLPFKIQ